MAIPIIWYMRGDRVIWRPENERWHWTSQYRNLVQLYGEGPFTVASIEPTAAFPHQRLELKNAAGETLANADGAPRRFDASWVKKAE